VPSSAGTSKDSIELAQFAGGMRQKIDADAERLQLGRGLVNTGWDPFFVQHQSKRQPPDPTTNNRDFHSQLQMSWPGNPAKFE